MPDACAISVGIGSVCSLRTFYTDIMAASTNSFVQMFVGREDVVRMRVVAQERGGRG